MALIKIRGRLEPITIDDARAKKIKERKFGVEGRVEKALPTELIDLGEWAGEYGRIVEIELSRAAEPDRRDEDRKREEEEARKKELAFIALPPEQKAKRCVFFEVAYCTRVMGQIKCEVPQEAADRAYQVRLKWFQENPKSSRCPVAEYPADLVPPRGRGARDLIADKMRVSHRPEEDVAYPT